ncbi:MAG: DinB family protein [Thermoanaerobaculia bacterium]
MFRRIDDFLEIWADERKKTLEAIRTVPAAKMGHSGTPASRSLGRLGWHLVESCVELPGHLGLAVDGPRVGENGFIAEPLPATMDEVAAAYDRASASVAGKVREWSDADLESVDELYGERWRRGFSLFVLVAHQAHHRAQMTVLMREAGLRPPALYGPTAEGWAAWGVAAPAV